MKKKTDGKKNVHGDDEFVGWMACACVCMYTSVKE